MSMPRDPHIPLPAHEPRCSAGRCPRGYLCARRMATLGPQPRMEDYSITTGWDAEHCAGFVDFTTLRRPQQPAAPVRPVRPFPSADD